MPESNGDGAWLRLGGSRRSGLRDGGRGIRLRLGHPNLGEFFVQRLQQPTEVEVEAGRAELQRLTAGQPGQAVRQLVGRRHRGPIDQNRDDADVTRQGGLDLQPDEVIGVVEARRPCSSVIVSHWFPISASEDVAGSDRAGDHLDEVVAQLDRVDVLEDLPAAVVVRESLVQPAGRVGGVIAPVADKDPTGGSCGGFDP